ncbi:DUF6090 family protein [Winogradskyella sp.]|uniref:DUF6090 family protein n=1 Tax=Winogradskyella sp. TaxID=1883156 RepID=UPI003BA925FE
MLSILRVFRKKVLVKRNFGKYLLYAFGELILVVMGILIALQINLWNTQKSNKNQERYALNRFSTDLISDIDQLTQLINATEKQLVDLDLIIQIMDDKDDISKFFKLQRSIHDINTFKPNMGTYDESISSGKLQLVLNDTLREQIFKYYREVSKCSADDAMSKMRDELFLPYINSNIYNTEQSIRFIFKTKAQLPKLDLDVLANDKDYFSILISAKGKYVQILNWQNYLQHAKNLKKKIQEELKTVDS